MSRLDYEIDLANLLVADMPAQPRSHADWIRHDSVDDILSDRSAI